MDRAWFGLGDRDLATHLVRTEMLEAGYPLSQVTEALCRRWLLPSPGRSRLLPMTDDRVETHVAIADPEAPSGRRVVHFQEYWVRLRAEVPAEAVLVVGQDDCSPAPGVIEAITDADLVVVPPSNPVVSVGTILGVPGVREAMTATPAPVVGLSPIIGGRHVRGMASSCSPRSASRSAPVASAATTAPARPRASSTAGWSTSVDADAARPGCVPPGCVRPPFRCS